MSAPYRLVQWTAFKRSTDLALMLGVLGFLGTYVGAALLVGSPGEQLAAPQLAIRAFGACAFALLTLILAIGPLARLSPRCLPLLYNRRHLGVTCFGLALVHAVVVVLWYHGFGVIDPLRSLLISNPRYGAIQGFPFESLGLLALGILFVMAATSHDFWNANLGPRTWKAIHMGVYPAYALVVSHVMLGAVQGDKGAAYPAVVAAGAALLVALHGLAARREARRDADIAAADGDWLRVGPVSGLTDGCARVITPPDGERIAVFRDGARVFAISNVCRHQGGPLGEGRIVDGCVTCPWHGFQYRADGRSPPPYREHVATYRTRVSRGEVYVDPHPAPAGRPATPTPITPPAP